MQTALENAARDELNEKVLLKVRELPQNIYDRAKSQEQEMNVDGAGEYYLRYLSCTSENGSAERQHAKEFLEEKLNMRPDAGATPSAFLPRDRSSKIPQAWH